MVQVGEIRQELAKDLQRRVLEAVNSKSHLKRRWWIFITSQWKHRMIQASGQALATKQRVLHTPLFMMDILPPQIASGVLKGILIEVDNRKGSVQVVWNLPADMTAWDQHQLSLDDKIIEAVYESAKQTGVSIRG